MSCSTYIPKLSLRLLVSLCFCLSLSLTAFAFQEADGPSLAPADEKPKPANPILEMLEASELLHQVSPDPITTVVSDMLAASSGAEPTDEELNKPIVFDGVTDRLAVLFSGPAVAELAQDALLSEGLGIVELEPLGVDTWTFAYLDKAHGDGPETDMAIDQLLALDGVSFVSPVWQNGKDWIFATPTILMRFKPGANPEDALTFARVPGLSVLDEHFGGMAGAYRLQGNPHNGAVVLEQANQLAQDPNVAWAEPDFIYSAQSHVIPNDPGFSNLWGFLNTGQYNGQMGMDMDVDLAWNHTTGSAQAPVLVMDSGSDGNHPDLNEITNDFTGSPRNGCDNHGTAVAGCISAIMNNNLGTVGVAPQSTALSARVFVSHLNCTGSGIVQSGWIVDALDWAEGLGARASNTSLSLSFTSNAVKNKFEDTRDAGMVHFASAGNDGISALGYPASLSAVNEVAAIQSNGGRAIFPGGSSSNYGPYVIMAPGRDIYTTDRVGISGYTGGDYVLQQGTSFASPYVAGVAALMMSANPTLSADQVETILQNTTRDLGSPGRDSIYGWGLVNADAAVQEAQRTTGGGNCGTYCHADLGYAYPMGQASLCACSSQPLTCPNTFDVRLQNAFPNQPAALLISNVFQPTPLWGTGNPLIVSPNPTTVNLTTDANGEILLPDIQNCGTDPLFIQVVYAAPFGLGTSNIVRLDLSTTTYHVGTGHAYSKIQDAINAASNGDTVVVHPGVYADRVDWYKPVNIVGSAPGVIVRSPIASKRRATVHQRPYRWPAGASARWDNVDIEGRAIDDFLVLSDGGQGTAIVTFENMRITDPNGAQRIATIGVTTPGNNVRFRDCTIIGNPAHAAVEQTNAAPLNLLDSTIYGGSPTIRIRGGGDVYAIRSTVWSGVANAETILLDGGTMRFIDSTLRTTGVETSAATLINRDNYLFVDQTLIDARFGTGHAPIWINTNEYTLNTVQLRGSALLFNSTTNAQAAAIDAVQGGEVNLYYSTIRDATTGNQSVVNPASSAIVGAGQPGLALIGTMDYNIIELQGSRNGAIREMGGRTLVTAERNIRYVDSGNPVQDALPGVKYNLDPMFQGWQYRPNNAFLPRAPVSSFARYDIGGFLRNGHTSYGCFHTSVTQAQTGLRVGTSQPYATIQSAIDAASPGDTIIVHQGNYDEAIQWNKPVDIVEAYGEQAVLRRVTPGTGAIITQSNWPDSADHRWDGIDVVAGAVGYTEVVEVQGLPNGVIVATFENCEFTDAGSFLPAITYFKVLGRSSFVSVDHVAYRPSFKYFEAFHVDDASYFSINHSYLETYANQAFLSQNGGNLSVNHSSILDRGSEILVADGVGTTVNLWRSRLVTATGRVSAYAAGFGPGGGTLGIVDSYIDARNGSFLTPIMFNHLNTGRVFMSNSALVFESGRTQTRAGIDASNGGDLNMNHCTINNVSTHPVSRQLSSAIHGPTTTAANLSGTISFNIFNLPGSDEGAILNFNRQSPGTVSVFSASNVVFLNNGLWDRLPGTKHNVNPYLAGDGFHLTAQSSGLPKVPASSIFTDIDGESRPNPSQLNKDYGCDEYYQ